MCLRKQLEAEMSSFILAECWCDVFFSISGGELFDRIIDEDFELTEREVIKYMLQIVDGVNFIHKKGIVHLDLKPENIMCVNKTGSKIKLIDFGLARRLGQYKAFRLRLNVGSYWMS